VKFNILARYHFLSAWNWRSVYLGRLIEPVAYLLLLGGGVRLAIAGHVGVDPTWYLVTGLMALVGFRAGSYTMGDVANDRKWGVLAIYRIQGGSAAGYVLSVMIFAIAFAAAQLLLVLVSALTLLGLPVAVLKENGVSMVVAGAVGVFWMGIGAVAGSRINSFAVRDLVITLTSLPVVLSAPLFYSLDGAPPYLTFIAHVNPLTYFVGLIRDGGIGAVFIGVVCAAGAFGLSSLAVGSASSLSMER
jgi:ABC-2 type transport system permease protein